MGRTTLRLVILSLLLSTRLPAQIPSTCFEIESILVDACGNPEPENEMVRFVIGPNDLNVADLNVNWPNNSFLGICQNVTTAGKVAAINSTVLSCGLILEPVGGVLPAGAEVILVGSVNMSTASNTFQSLTDTIYMIFQCAGNSSAGHFKNYEPPPSNNRTLQMDFGAGCSDNVSYLPSNLVDMSGIHTTADGAYVNFSWSGTPAYGNNGCQAIYQIPALSVQASTTSACPGDTITLSAVPYNTNPLSYNWSGGSGTFTAPASPSTDYILGPTDAGTVTLYIQATTSCAPVTDSISFTTIGPVIGTLQAGTLSPYCEGDVVTLSASGGHYLWNTGATSANIDVDTEGNYIVTVSNNCFTQTDSLYIAFSSVHAAFTATPETGAAPLEVEFTDSSSSNAVKWNWDFGDGNTSQLQFSSNIYTVAGIYTASLLVTNPEGCTSIAYKEITVTGDTVTFIPSAFSPDNDTRNETFVPVGMNVLNTKGVIYNRWGQVISQWENSEGWDGKDINGHKVEQGIYIYDVHSTYVWGQTQRFKGWVMVVK
jgi:gliding motility-associated-like protein